MSLAKTAIVGVGATGQGRIPDESASEIAVRGAFAAMADAGIDKCLSATAQWKEGDPPALISHATYHHALSADTATAIPIHYAGAAE